jgi:hypothetical protein
MKIPKYSKVFSCIGDRNFPYAIRDDHVLRLIPDKTMRAALMLANHASYRHGVNSPARSGTDAVRLTTM